MAVARLQWFPAGGGCLRVWDDDHAIYGDDYDWACAVEEHLDVDTITIHGVDKPLTKDRDKAIRRCLRGMGIRTVHYTRRNGGRVRNVTRRLRKN